MSFMEEIQKMDPKEIANRPEVKALWEKPSFLWSLSHRRSYKYPRGIPFPKDGYFDYKKVKEVVPLTAVETAILCWAGAGTNGIIRNDVPLPGASLHQSFEGRVTPVGDNVWWRYLMFANDDGVFLYTPHVPTKPVEIETQEDIEIIFRAFKEGVTQINDENLSEKLHIPSIMAVFGVNQDFTFRPGVTMFFPLVETTIREINFLFLGSHQGPPENRRIILDDATGEPAGVQKWVDNGWLKGFRLPLSMFEAAIVNSSATLSACAMQNLGLCATAMGMGSYPYSGYNPMVLMGGTPLMKGFSLRFASDKRGFPYPIGIDGLIESHMPPYMSMDEAVDDMYNMRWGPDGRYNPAVKEGDKSMYPGLFPQQPRAVHRAVTDPDKYCEIAMGGAFSPECVQYVKDFCNYIYNTYGRMPKAVDPYVSSGIVQVQHIDCDFYDQYFTGGSIWQEQREHLRTWHGINE